MKGWGVYLTRNCVVDKHVPEGRILWNVHITEFLEKIPAKYEGKIDKVLVAMKPCGNKQSCWTLHRAVWDADENVKLKLMGVSVEEFKALPQPRPISKVVREMQKVAVEKAAELPEEFPAPEPEDLKPVAKRKVRKRRSKKTPGG